MEVISLTKDKVLKIKYRHKNAYLKNTTKDELINLRRAEKFLKNKEIMLLNEKYQIRTPKIYLWNKLNQQIIMEECKGENLELMLRNKNRRTEGIKILHTFMKFILDESFFWHDFAPRNILINNEKKEIELVDFEKGITLEKDFDIKHFLRENVYEEYAAFLLPEERALNEKKVFSIGQNEDDIKLSIESIKSNRVKQIATKLGIKKYILMSQYLNILHMIISAEEPFKRKDNTIFPIVELENILQEKGYSCYTDEIIKRYKNINEREI